ncbi:hypothetical protein GCM10027589_11050 [Actinocorallia lasiicapitis]
MELISPKDRRRLIEAASEHLHLETRDTYGGDQELIDAWNAGDRAPFYAATKSWRDEVEAGVAAGKTYRRIRIVSEPLSPYQAWAMEVGDPSIAVGEDIRICPRRLVSEIALPGNDFWLLDGTAVFTVFSGADDKRVEIQLTDDPRIVALCRDAFETVWPLAVPQLTYRPSL